MSLCPPIKLIPGTQRRLRVSAARLSVYAAIFLRPLEAWAAGANHEPHLSDLGPFIVNFVIYLTVLVFVVRKPLAKLWQERRQQTDEALKVSAQALSQAEQIHERAATRLLNLDQEIRALEERIAQDADSEAAAIKERGAILARRLAEQAEMSGRAERTRAEAAVRAALVDAIIQGAGSRLQQELTLDNDRPFRTAAVQGASILVDQ